MRRQRLFKLILHTVFVLGCSTSTVRVKNGLPDVAASVGRLFNYTLPRDAFEGPVAKFKVTEAGSDRLPRWLQWDEAKGALIGVPATDDAGPNFIAVSAYGPKANGTPTVYAQDVFSMDVHHFDVAIDESCSGDKGLAAPRLLVVLNRDLVALAPSSRVSLLRSAADQWLETNASRVRLLEWQDVSPALADIALSGDADLATLTSSLTRQAVLLLTIGCEKSFSSPVAVALTSFMKRLGRQPNLAPSMEGKEPIGALCWAIVTLRKYHRKRQVDQVRDVQSRYASVGYNTDIYGETNWFTPTPQRPWLSVRPTGRIELKPGVTIVSSTRVTASMGSPESEDQPLTRTRLLDITTARPKANSRPEVRKSLGTVVCYKGVVCEVRIPDDTFYDVEDGSTVTLRLSLNRLDDQSRPEWMYLDTLDRTLFGLSLETGQWQYSLTANDSGGSAISDAFAIRVLEATGGHDEPHEQRAPNHRVRLALAEDLKYLRQRPSNFVKLVRRLAQYFGESELGAVLVHSIEPGSTVIQWSNGTLLKEKCPRLELGRLIGRMRRKDGQPRREFVSFMRPEFTPISVSISYEGACEPSSPPEGQSTVAPAFDKKPSVTSEPDDGGSSLMSTLLPAIIILLLLIIAGVISCVYYRRSRRAGKHPEDAERKYLSKGTPIIFPDEVDADNECNATSPMLLKEEKPPLQVTELSSFQPNNLVGSSTPKVDGDDQQKQQSSDDGASDGTSNVRTPVMERTTENPLYRPPPPPFDSNRLAERSPKPKHGHPAFREPPPYVPP
uniref:Dystroglycan 1 n=1 Tax=Trichuris muris TaxID=70415 RepID=A0A5S6QX18_TRIMR